MLRRRVSELWDGLPVGLVSDARDFVIQGFRITAKAHTGVQQVMRAQARRAYDRTLPDGEYTPAKGIEKMEVAAIPRSVASNLFAPECRTRFGPLEPRTIVGMPETAVDKNGDTVLGKNKVWLTGEIWRMQPKS